MLSLPDPAINPIIAPFWFTIGRKIPDTNTEALVEPRAPPIARAV